MNSLYGINNFTSNNIYKQQTPFDFTSFIPKHYWKNSFFIPKHHWILSITYPYLSPNNTSREVCHFFGVKNS